MVFLGYLLQWGTKPTCEPGGFKNSRHPSGTSWTGHTPLTPLPWASEDTPFLCRLCPIALTWGTLAVTAVLGAEGVGSVAAAEAAVVIHVQQQAGWAHRAVLSSGSLALYAALMAFFTVKVFSLVRTAKRLFLRAEVEIRNWSSPWLVPLVSVNRKECECVCVCMGGEDGC